MTNLSLQTGYSRCVILVCLLKHCLDIFKRCVTKLSKQIDFSFWCNVPASQQDDAMIRAMPASSVKNRPDVPSIFFAPAVQNSTKQQWVLVCFTDTGCTYSDTPKASDKARRWRQYAVVRRSDATPYEAFGDCYIFLRCRFCLNQAGDKNPIIASFLEDKFVIADCLYLSFYYRCPSKSTASS